MDMQQLNLENVKGQVLEAKKKGQQRRRRSFINPSVQGTYIAFSIIPAVLATLFCTYSLIYSGEIVLRAAKESPLVPIYTMRQTIEELEKEGHNNKTASKVRELKTELTTLKLSLEDSYHNTKIRWNAIRWQIFAVMFWCFVLVGSLALIFSHRIAGPLFRIGKCIDQFAEGKDSGPVRLRKRDHYKNLASSVENLRQSLIEKGVLHKKVEV
jgi:hypothetical protein